MNQIEDEQIHEVIEKTNLESIHESIHKMRIDLSSLFHIKFEKEDYLRVLKNCKSIHESIHVIINRFLNQFRNIVKLARKRIDLRRCELILESI